MVQKNTSRNESLQVLRCLAFLGIFICHTGFNGYQSLGAWGVSVFIILSGFLMVYNYYGQKKIQVVSFKNNLIFAINKIKKLYPLHVATMLAMLVFLLTGDRTDSYLNILLKIVLNLFLVQEWFPLADREINGMSWFLCIMLFFYFIFPWVLKKMDSDYSKKKAWIMIGVSILFQVMIGLLSNGIVWEPGANSIWVNDISRWLIYYFPMTRFLEFFIGCNVGYIFIKEEHLWKDKTYSKIEIGVLVWVLICNLIYLRYATPNVLDTVVVKNTTEKWWMFTVLFVISSSALVYTFALGRGIISKKLVNKFVLYVAKLSPFTFLIHTVVFRYLSIIYYHIPSVDGEWFAYTYGRWINLTVGFVLTIFAAAIWDRLSNWWRIRCGKQTKG